MDLLEGVCAACGQEGLGLEAKRCSRELLRSLLSRLLVPHLHAKVEHTQGLNGREFWLVGIKGDPKVVTWISSPCRFEPRLA